VKFHLGICIQFHLTGIQLLHMLPYLQHYRTISTLRFGIVAVADSHCIKSGSPCSCSAATVCMLPKRHQTLSKLPDYSKLSPLFGWLSPDLIQKTFEHTTQYACLPTGTLHKWSFKSAKPALSVLQCKESIACDIVCADVPATIDDGSTAAFLFGYDTQVAYVYGIKTASLLTPLKTTYINRVLPTNSSLIALKWKLATSTQHSVHSGHW